MLISNNSNYVNTVSKSIFCCLCSLLFILPLLLGGYRPWAITSIGILICAVFVLHILARAVQYRDDPPSLYPPSYCWPLFLILAVVIVTLCIQLIPSTSFTSIDTNKTKLTLLKTIYITLFCWLITRYCTTPTRLKFLIYTLLVSAVFQAIYAAYLNFSPQLSSPFFDYPYKQRAIGSFSYANFLANYLALCLSLGIGLLVSELVINPVQKSPIQQLRALTKIMLSNKVILRLALIIMIIGLILTRSRMGNSAFFIALSAVSIYALFFYRRKPKHLRTLIISFFIIDLIIIGALFGVEKVTERLSQTSLSSETRDEVLHDSIPLILDKPWLGSGGGSFYTAFPAYQPQPYSGYYDNAHNDYIQFAVELGIPTTMLLGALTLFCLYNCIVVMHTRKTPLYQGLAFGCAIAIIHMLLHSSVDYSLQAGANTLTFMLILTLSFIIKNIPTTTTQRNV
ncbi:hypothetical protein PPRY_a4333 [Pseudoalteromonas prydzensis ACAM 620]|nr:hypothetical protein [Pseudoalteromonas prydzensis ACAM 620]